MECHKAFKKKIVPGYVFRDHKNEKHFTIDMLSWKYNVPRATLRKLIKQRKIKVRKVSRATEVVLRRENPNLGDILSDEVEASKKPD